MAHRTLVAYRTGDTCTLHYAHWGENLGEAITPTTPFGGPAASDDRPDLSAVAERFGFDVVTRDDGRTRVETEPLTTDVTPDAVLSAIDASIETLIVVDAECATRTYLVCPLGVDGEGRLVLVGPTDEERRLRRWIQSVKSRLGERVDEGALPAETAQRVLRHALETRAAVHERDDASFLFAD
ncbi:hypothetical protein BRC91_03270 [Halobacteriales archaeon QS_4_62_28]|nr:MAG: hypothetical protein BRC91_03270 [Halobacteriales archaeon QS_4_62_28]